MNVVLKFRGAIALTLALNLPLRAEEKPSPVQTLIPWLLKEDQSFTGIPFSEVIAATTGKKIIPFDPKDADDQRILAKIGVAMDEVLRQASAPDSELKTIKRINEVSSHFEDADANHAQCHARLYLRFPTDRIRRDSALRLSRFAARRQSHRPHLLSRPKALCERHRNSSFRTFYFEPKRDTNKVNDDAHHLIVGIEHDRDEARMEVSALGTCRSRPFPGETEGRIPGQQRDLYQPEAIDRSRPKIETAILAIADRMPHTAGSMNTVRRFDSIEDVIKDIRAGTHGHRDRRRGPRKRRRPRDGRGEGHAGSGELHGHARPRADLRADHRGTRGAARLAADGAGKPREPSNTDFTVSVDAAAGITTGISAARPRARRSSVLVDRKATPQDLVQPGHVFPLQAKGGGVLRRAGHTEASVDLARLAGLAPAGVICEILHEDGTMARLPELLKFSKKHGLKICTHSKT